MIKMKNTNPIHAINKISSLNDNFEYYANEHKDELKGDFIGERQITGIGVKCLKLDNDFLKWEDIDEQYLNFIDGVEITGEMEEIITFFLSQEEFLNGLNKEFQEKFGVTIQAPKSNKTEHRELILVQTGTLKNEKIYSLNQRVDRNTWEKIKGYFQYRSYNDQKYIDSYVCTENDVQTVQKILNCTIQNSTDGKEIEKIIDDFILDDDIIEKCNKEGENGKEYSHIRYEYRKLLQSENYEINHDDYHRVFLELLSILLQEGYVIKQVNTCLTWAVLLKKQNNLELNPAYTTTDNPFVAPLIYKFRATDDILSANTKAYLLAKDMLNFAKENVKCEDYEGVYSYLLFEKLEQYIQEQGYTEYTKEIGNILENAGFIIIDDPDTKKIINFVDETNGEMYLQMQGIQQENRRNFIDETICSKKQIVSGDYNNLKSENNTVICINNGERRSQTYYVKNDGEIWVCDGYTQVFEGYSEDIDIKNKGLYNFPDSNGVVIAFKTDYDEDLWSQILRFACTEIGIFKVAEITNISTKDLRNINLEYYRIISYNQFLHEQEIDEDIDFWEQEELNEMYDED